ncbi:hypothetical protein JNW88_20185 [Micromonospora sp. ATA32]|nr:hypothetical protein [Micromonospora sp. ATA32]
MTGGSDWRDVKAKARELDPSWAHPERVARRGQLREQMLASVSGAQLAEIRKQLGMTQTQLGTRWSAPTGTPAARSTSGASPPSTTWTPPNWRT